MRTQQAGFTLIELIVVIVILGILGAIAVPKFVDLSGDAYDSSAKASAGALSSASALNYAKKNTGSGGFTIVAGTTKCSALSTNLMTGGALSSDTAVTFAADNAVCTALLAGDMDKTSCMVKHTSGATTTGFPVSVICTGP
jgi:MSHA pilin protein MshA